MSEVSSDDRVPARRPAVRVLDPATATRRSPGDVPLTTAYLVDRLLVAGYPESTRAPSLTDLSTELEKLGVAFSYTTKSARRIEQRRSRRLELDPLDDIWVSSIELVASDHPTPPPDAWHVLQRLRASNSELAARVSLEHVIQPAGGNWGGVSGNWGGVSGNWGGVSGNWGGVSGNWGGVGDYGRPGFGGRMPVSVAMPDPALRARDIVRRPVVAIVDTGVADHPWFPRPGKSAKATAPGAILRMVVRDGGLEPQGATPEVFPAFGEVDPLTGDRQSLEGHGTFIAGLIRQGCPEAVIMSVPVMGNDGLAEEGDILAALNALLRRHVDAQEGERLDEVVDVLSLSMGYYAEGEDYETSPIAGILGRFAEHGVLVVAGVGNDATSAPFVPACLAEPPTSDDASSRLPIASVGALNPDGRSIALFSNAFKYVTALRPGVALVSTMPAIDGAGQPSVAVTNGHSLSRTTMDPDCYLGGFGVWSGTSFATPTLAAEAAAEIAAAPDLADVSADAMRGRATKALEACIRRNPS